MTRADLEQAGTRALVSVAPEIEFLQLKSDVPLRDQIDIDSMDFLRFVMEIHTRLGVDVPEADYQQLASLDSAVNYLAGKLGVKDR